MRSSPRLRLRHVLAAALFSVAAAEHHHSSRRLEIASDTSDPYADAKVFANVQGPGVGAVDHARITSILTTTKEVINTARLLFKDPESQNEANEMLAMATAMFGEVKDFMKGRQEKLQLTTEEDRLLRAKYASHNIHEAREDEERALDITRNMYETVSAEDRHKFVPRWIVPMHHHLFREFHLAYTALSLSLCRTSVHFIPRLYGAVFE
jgi:hypothetical protein